MTTSLYTVYPLDLTMSMASNHIENETKTFANAKERIFVPDGGPFYSQSLIIKDGAGRLLKPNVDYKLLHLNEEATLESNRDVVCVIWILKDTIASVNLDYRVVGGQYGNTVSAILDVINKGGSANGMVDWNTNVVNKPSQFPPAPHYHTPETFTGWSMVYSQLEGIRKAIVVGDDASWESHYNYLNRVVGNVKSEVDANLSNHPTFQQMNAALTGVNVSVDLSGYYNKTQIDATVREIKTTTDSLRNTFSNYYTKTSSDGRYAYKTDSYTKSESDRKYLVASALAPFITETKADGKYALKTDLAPYVKTVTLTDEIGKLNLRIDSITGNIKPTDLSNYYTKQETYSTAQTYSRTQIDNAFAKITDVYTKTASDGRYGGAGQVAEHERLIRELSQQIEKLKISSEQYKVGDLYVTTLNHANGAAVTAHLGYGVWQPYAEGKALVGSNPSMPKHWTARAGNVYGSDTHKLKTEELPEDGLKVKTAGYHGARNHGGGGDTYASASTYSSTMLPVSSRSSGWLGKPINNVQLSNVVGVWIRVDGNYKPPLNIIPMS